MNDYTRALHQRCQYCGSNDPGLGWQHGEALVTYKKHGLLGIHAPSGGGGGATGQYDPEKRGRRNQTPKGQPQADAGSD